jgi:PTS system nitrogen regulatory IIA component
MLLANYLKHGDVLLEQRVLTMPQAYQVLVERLCKNHRLPVCGNALLQLVLKRESEMSTAYPSGLAIPHVRMDGFEDIVLAMMFLQNPLDYGDTKVSWIALIITDAKSSKLYLNIVAALMAMSRDQQLMRTLHSFNDGTAVVNHIRRMGIEVDQELTLADIMITEPHSIHPDATLRDLIQEMDHCKVAGLPVVDHKNRYLGEVNILDILRVGIPDYLMMIDDLAFLSTFEPLENLFEKQDILHVRDIMWTDGKTLPSNASVMEAVYEMMQYRRRYISVVDAGELKGVITAMDIFRKIVKA